MKSPPSVAYNKTMRRWVLGLLSGGALLFFYQNCSSGFTTLTSSELNSLSCGTKFQCDAGGNPIGKIVIDQLPASGYPTGSFSNARLDTKTLVVNDTGMISFLRLKLPDGMACQQTWLRGSYALQGGINTLELLGALQNMPCRTGDVPQENEFLDLCCAQAVSLSRPATLSNRTFRLVRSVLAPMVRLFSTTILLDLKARRRAFAFAANSFKSAVTTAHRVWNPYGLQPWCHRNEIKQKTDPLFYSPVSASIRVGHSHARLHQPL